jgi:solute carrier family 66 (lysosomal lysine-arginine transporter), member 1
MNLIGAMLTRQATWQIILEVYYVTADLTLVLQYVWYTHWRQCRQESQQAYEVITGDNSADDPAGQGFQDTSFIENGYEDNQAVKKRSGGGA